MTQRVLIEDLGTTDYKQVWDYQEILLKELVAEKSRQRITEDPGAAISLPHHFLLTEHQPVLTLGKSGLMEHVLLSEDALAERGISFYKINRGGDITFHGPGQWVGYPILDLERFYTDIGRYLRNLEEVIIRMLNDYGIKGERSAGETGVWIDAGIKGNERKICAMGIRCSRWVTMHGFALNVNTDLSYFNYIIPCGIRDKAVTSMQKELGRNVSMSEVKERLLYHFGEVFDVYFEQQESRLMDHLAI